MCVARIARFGREMALANPMHLPTKYNKPHLAERALLGLLIMPLSVFVYPWAAEPRTFTIMRMSTKLDVHLSIIGVTQALLVL